MAIDTKNISWPGWETVKPIGRGSYGSVYEIQRDVFGEIEKAALKVISIPQNESDIEELYNDGYDADSITSTLQSYLKDIIAEYSLMRKMNGSSNIVNCDDVRYVPHEDGIGWDIFIKMELLTPLNKALPPEVPEETVIKLAKDMCCALDLCKRYEILHRDIKPQNIFLSPNGDFKLGDFGIAKTVDKTMEGTRIGTYRYMAPEIYNNRPYGASSDIYSLGLVLYWLLNKRRLPFVPLPPVTITVNMDQDAQSRRLTGEELPPPADGSEALKRIVLKACAYSPSHRYESAAEMLRDLNQIPTYITNPTPSSPDPGSYSGKTELLTPALRPNPDFSMAETVVLTSNQNSGPVKSSSASFTPVTADSAPPLIQNQPKNKKKPVLWLGLGCCAALILVLGLLLFGKSGKENTPAIHKYSYHVENCTWNEAFTSAAEKGGYLVHIDSMEEWEYIIQQIESLGYQDKYFFIGGRRKTEGSTYHWADAEGNLSGEPLNDPSHWGYPLWFKGEPSIEYNGKKEYFMEMNRDENGNWGWNDVKDRMLPNQTSLIAYIVEYEY